MHRAVRDTISGGFSLGHRADTKLVKDLSRCYNRIEKSKNPASTLKTNYNLWSGVSF